MMNGSWQAVSIVVLLLLELLLPSLIQLNQDLDRWWRSCQVPLLFYRENEKTSLCLEAPSAISCNRDHPKNNDSGGSKPSFNPEEEDKPEEEEKPEGRMAGEGKVKRSWKRNRKRKRSRKHWSLADTTYKSLNVYVFLIASVSFG